MEHIDVDARYFKKQYDDLFSLIQQRKNDYEELKRLKLKLKEKEDQKNKPKQVIIVRKDLNMNAGKLAAAGVQEEFIILSINDKNVSSQDDIEKILKNYKRL